MTLIWSTKAENHEDKPILGEVSMNGLLIQNRGEGLFTWKLAEKENVD